MASSKDGTGTELSPSGLPIKPVPGSTGIPFLSSIKDRLDFYYFKGHMTYFKSRIEKYKSTVLRLNVPPGLFLARNPKVVAVLDASSFRVLLDSSKVDKTNTLTGTYIPPLSLYSGLRPLAYLDTTDPLHTSLKTLIFSLLASRKSHVIPSFCKIYGSIFDEIKTKVDTSGPTEFNTLNQSASFDFTCRAFFDGSLPSESIGPSAAEVALKWLFFQLHPLVSKVSDALPWPIEDFLLHNFHLPPCLVKSGYKSLETYFSEVAKTTIDEAEQLGISRHVALHNLIFATIFNAYGGIKIFLPYLLKCVAQAGPELHKKLAEEIRSVIQSENGSVTLAGMEKMHLTKSVVFEALRLNPPVEYQYGKAREDIIIESHETAYKIKKGEMIFGYQPIATQDERIFKNGESFMPDRFLGEEGEKLLNYVYWSNGMETSVPAVSNKQCPGKDMVGLVGRLFLVELFSRYDTFTADVGMLPLEPKITFKSITSALNN